MSNDQCNVPGCEEPLGDYGVWCSDHCDSVAANNQSRTQEEP